ncbi:MAG: hypoxanthine phosphoribosyltransferase, partial [Clostridiales bacterium]|nr:hypoxanthine phosphoribosyltransferase [Clostridiales bacterium]
MKSKREKNKNIKRIAISEKQIKKAIAKMGKKLKEEYQGKPLLLVSVLNGAF